MFNDVVKLSDDGAVNVGTVVLVKDDGMYVVCGDEGEEYEPEARTDRFDNLLLHLRPCEGLLPAMVARRSPPLHRWKGRGSRPTKAKPAMIA